MQKHHFYLALAALSLTLQSQPAKAEGKLEKCYGIVKAGKNDCAAEDGSHSCATYAKKTGYGQDFIGVPAGTCARIIGASTTPTDAAGTYVATTKEQ